MSSAPELQQMRPTWIDIDTAAFVRNVDTILAGLPEGSRLIAVLKADAYGHGAVELARCCLADRVAMIAVIMLEEALELRRAGVSIPLLILGPLTAPQIPVAVNEGFVIGIPGPEELADICAVARDREVRVHLKLDSGMGRMGSTERDLPRVIEMVRATPKLKVEALYTHLANSGDPRDPFTDEQTANFDRMAGILREAGINPPLHHRANSGASMRGLVRPGEYARVGISLYGAEALDVGSSKLELVMRWRTEIARLKELPPGHAVGYGETFRTRRTSRIATLPVGYADGYNRRLSNNGEVLVRGRRVPVVGRVSMDLITIDVTEVPDAALRDEVVLLGTQGNETITPEEIAARTGTISYEVFTGISARVPRLYRTSEQTVVRSRFE